MADVGPILEAGFDHVPAERALEPAEDQQPDHLPAVAPGNRPHRREADEPHGEDESDQPSEKTVDELPPVNVLELGQGHARRAVDLAIFRGRPIKGEGVLPIGVGKRRDSAGNGVPLGDREAAFGEAGDAADDDHGEDHRGDQEQQVGERCRAGSAGTMRRSIGCEGGFHVTHAYSLAARRGASAADG